MPLPADIKARLDQFQEIDANLHKDLVTERAQRTVAAENSGLKLRVHQLERELSMAQRSLDDANANCERLTQAVQGVDRDHSADSIRLAAQLDEVNEARRHLEARNDELLTELESARKIWAPMRQDLENGICSQAAALERVQQDYEMYQRTTESRFREMQTVQQQRDREMQAVMEKMSVCEAERARLEGIRAELEGTLNVNTRDYNGEREHWRTRDRELDSARIAMNDQIIDLKQRTDHLLMEKNATAEARTVERTRLVADIRALEKKLNSHRQHDAEKSAALNTDITDLKTKLENAFIREKALWQEIKEKVEPLEKSQAALKELVLKHESDHAQTKELCKAQEDEIKDLTQQIDRVTMNADAALKKLMADYNGAKEEIEILRNQNNNLNSRRLQELDEIRNKVAEQIGALNDRIQVVDQENTRLRNDLDAAARMNERQANIIQTKEDQLALEKEERVIELASIRNDVADLKERSRVLLADLEAVKADRARIQTLFEEHMTASSAKINELETQRNGLIARVEENAEEYNRVLAGEKAKFEEATELARVSDENARFIAAKLAENQDFFQSEVVRYQREIDDKVSAILELNRQIELLQQRTRDMAEEYDRKVASYEQRFRRLSDIERQHSDVISAKEKLLEDLRVAMTTNEELRRRSDGANASEIQNLRDNVEGVSRENEVLTVRSRDAESRVITLENDFAKAADTVARLEPAVAKLEEVNSLISQKARQEKAQFAAEKSELVTCCESMRSDNEQMSWSLQELRAKYDKTLTATVELERRCNQWQSQYEPMKIRHDQMLQDMDRCHQRIQALETTGARIAADAQNSQKEYIAALNQERQRYNALSAKERGLREQLQTMSSEFETHRAAATQKINQLTNDLANQRGLVEDIRVANENLKSQGMELRNNLAVKCREMDDVVGKYQQIEMRCGQEMAQKDQEMRALQMNMDTHFNRLRDIGVLAMD